MGHQTFSMNRAFSARRFSRLRENIRNSASRVMIPATVPMMLYASGTFSRRKNVDDIQYQSRPDHGQRQPVHTVAPIHEARQRVANTLQEVHKTVPLPSASTPQVF